MSPVQEQLYADKKGWGINGKDIFETLVQGGIELTIAGLTLGFDAL